MGTEVGGCLEEYICLRGKVLKLEGLGMKKVEKVS